MTTRRQLLAAAGLSATAGLLSACKQTPAAVVPGDRLLVTHRDGLGVFDGGTGKWLVEPKNATMQGNRLATIESGRLLVREADSMRISSEGQLADVWTPRAVWRDQVALVAGAHPATDIYRPAPRTRTTLLITREGKEHKRFDLEGNFEPEAFSADGQRMFVLDYLPPQAPDVYRVRVLDLATGQLQPLLTQAKTVVPPDAEEVMRGQGRQAVYDATRRTLFTLYTHGGDHQHTGQLLGVRPDAPNIHAFIHALNLEIGSAVCIDLPAPFGTSGPAGHAIAMAANGSELYAVSAEHGTVAVVNPDELVVGHMRQFTAGAGEAFALGVAEDRLLIGAGRRLTAIDVSNRDEWELDFEVRGLAQGERLWVGRADGAVALQWEGRKEVARVDIAGLIGLRQAFSAPPDHPRG